MIDRINWQCAIVGVLALALVSCGKTPTDGTTVAGDPPVQPAPIPKERELKPTLQSIQADFVNVKCISCHMTATDKNRYVVLTDLSKLIEGGGHTHGPGGTHHHRHLIKPGCPKQSFFLSILKEGKMPPPPAQKISEKELNVISDWITGLKPSADCKDDEPPDGPESGNFKR